MFRPSLATKRAAPVTFVCAVRTNEWNTAQGALGLSPDEEYSLGNLSLREAQALCELLGAHKCLGELEHLSQEEQVKRLVEVHDRQLLVSLHEATAGKGLRAIIRDEYTHLLPAQAQILYLDICSLHRLGVPVRAGLVSRLTGIRFEDFQSRFLKPLERVVAVQSDWHSRDFVYKARHRDIAQILF